MKPSVVIATCAVLVLTGEVLARPIFVLVDANGLVSMVAEAFTNLGAQGFGAAPRMLNL